VTDQPWDAIVIGAGLGGLSTAAYLTTNGMRTLVLEQNQVAGGCSQVFRRRGRWEFDVGVHYVGGCDGSGAISRVLRGLGLAGRIQWRELDPDGYATLIFPDLTFRVPKGWDNYLARLIETFPAERRRLRICVGLLRRMAAEISRGVPRHLAAAPFRMPATLFGATITLQRLFDLCRLSPRARAVIVGESGDYSCPPSRTAAAFHAGFLNHYLSAGAYYPAGGGQVLAGHLIDVITSHGGAVHTNVRVEKILVAGGRARGVQVRGGEQIAAPVVVSNADIKRTYFELVGREHLSAATVARVEKFRMALPIFSVYLGLDIDLSERLPNTTFWAYADDDIEGTYQQIYAGRVPDSVPIFMTSASVKDPGNPHAAPPGHSTLEVMTIVPAGYEFWSVGDSPGTGQTYRRDAAYLATKDALTRTLIDHAARLIPGLREHIVFAEASTPITQERFTLSSAGSCYGIELARDQVGPRRPRPRTEIAGLYLTGASTIYNHGISGSLSGGMGTASSILRRDLAAEVAAGRVFADRSRLRAGGDDWDPLFASKPRATARPARRIRKPAATASPR
jgi:all-trans-retinol 13,14-reductase